MSRHSVGFRVERGRSLGERKSGLDRGRGNPAYWERSVTNSLVTQQALPLPGSQFHLHEVSMAYIYDFPNFLPSVVKHVFLKIICFKYTAS